MCIRRVSNIWKKSCCCLKQQVWTPPAKKNGMLKPSPLDPNRRFHLERLGSGQVGVGWAWGGWDRPDLVGVVVGSTPCQVGWGRVGAWVESGTGWGRMGVVSVSSRAGSGWGQGRVGDGSGSYGGCLRVKSGRVGLGSGSSRGRVGVALGLSPCQLGPGRVGFWVESGMGRGRVGVDSLQGNRKRYAV